MTQQPPLTISLRQRYAATGFTLAELLTSLAILGVIAIFSIPKIISAQQNTQSNALAHEAAATIAGAYQLYIQNNTLTGSTTAQSLTQYMNYAKVVSSGGVDDIPGRDIGYDCGSLTCLKLHNGGILFTDLGTTFNGIATTNAIYFFFDPDGTRGTSGTADSPGKSVSFWLYYNGRITSSANVLPNTSYANNGGSNTTNPGSNADPSWFSW